MAVLFSYNCFKAIGNMHVQRSSEQLQKN